jgi:hypothetical protein
MSFMNDYDIQQAKTILCGSGQTPNAGHAIGVLENLMDWTNANSDGWAYWPKPARSAKSLMRCIEVAVDDYRRGNDDLLDLTDDELKKLYAPIKSFLTRNGVDHAEVFWCSPQALFSWCACSSSHCSSRPTTRRLFQAGGSPTR